MNSYTLIQRNKRQKKRRTKLIQTWTLRILISTVIVFSIALTIILAISFGMWISTP